MPGVFFLFYNFLRVYIGSLKEFIEVKSIK